MTSDFSFLRGIRTKQDYDRAREEFEMRKRQRAMQEQLTQAQIDQMRNQQQRAFQGTGFDAQIANTAYQDFVNQGVSPSEAKKKAVDLVLKTKTEMLPVTDPYTKKTTFEPAPRRPIFEVGAQPTAQTPNYRTGQKPLFPQEVSPLTQEQLEQPTNLPSAPTVPLQPSDFQRMMSGEQVVPSARAIPPEVNPMALESPDVQKAIAKDITKMSYQDQLNRAKEDLKTERGNQKVQIVLNRMREINEALRDRGAIVTETQTPQERLGAYMATTALGQQTRKVSDPQSQSLAQEYKNLQSVLLPFYASAAGLGAKSLDSEGERKSILESFGDPGGIYETNLRQIQNLENVFSAQPKTQMQEAQERFNATKQKIVNFEDLPE